MCYRMTTIIQLYQELAVYDPVLSEQYYRSWARLTHTPIAHTELGMFCPDLTNPSLARYYGVSYVLATNSGPTLDGMRPVGHYQSEKLYRVPGGGVMTLEAKGAPTRPLQRNGSWRSVPIPFLDGGRRSGRSSRQPYTYM